MLALAGCASHDPTPDPTPEAAATARADFAGTAALLAGSIEHAREAYSLPGVSIALVAGDEIVWSAGFGDARADTIHRVGSVSKLFTDVALMRMVERGELDLDAPVTETLADFAPENPFDGAITARQLAAHRAGLVREPPLGHYFDDTGTTLAQTVQSLNDTTLVHAPDTVTKYSNAGIAVLGFLLEHAAGEPFEDVVAREVLSPVGIAGSASFRRTPEVTARLGAGWMWAYDRPDWPAPPLELGMSPAGNLYASVLDLAQFLKVLFADGEGPNGQLLEAASIEAMTTPLRDTNGDVLPFGIGFHVDELDGHKRCGHGGAVYGFATQLAFLPEAELGVAVVSTVDCTNVVTSRLATLALRSMLAERQGAPLPAAVRAEPIPAQLRERLAGTWRAGERTIRFSHRSGELVLEGPVIRDTLRTIDGKLVVDGRLARRTEVTPLAGGALEIDGERYERYVAPRPAPPAAGISDLIGEYGWDHNVLFVYERDDGSLGALIEWFYDEPLRPLETDLFAFRPRGGLYHGETLRFVRDGGGRVTGASLSGLVFPRRAVGPEDGAGFRIDPVRPVTELRPLALAAEPPEEGPKQPSELIDVVRLDPTLALDVRYATTDNFMGAVFYESPHAFLQRPAAEALGRVQSALEAEDLGLLLFDAYRPWHVTRMFWDATPEALKDFVADPAKGSRHNRGCAVDLTLRTLSGGSQLPSTSGYDEFSPRAYPFYPGGTAAQRWCRDRLRTAMEAEGFTVYRYEWWHFDYQGWERWPIQDVTFDALEAEVR
ncbi:MAG: serine hydrolase [bacterium]|nr:serine hydrolase [bacterium]